MERETRKEYRYEGLGFPVIIEDASMVKLRGRWVLDMDLNHLQDTLFRAMSKKRVRLTGNEIRFIRHHARMTLKAFAERFGVTHAAVIKWEKTGAQPTNMQWSTEKDIRLFVLEHSDAPSREFKKAYIELKSQLGSQRRLHRLNVREFSY